MSAKRKGLGRGLDALMGDGGESRNVASANASAGGGLREVPLAQLQPGKGQPRRHFDEGDLRALADSIRKHGILQPVVARLLKNGKWQIIAGERRWRAAKLAGKTSVPVVQREADEQQAATLALVENLQRADLNPMEQSRGLAQLIADGGLTHAAAGAEVGMSRAAVSNLLRLAELSPGASALVEIGKLPMAHARALLSLPPKTQDSAARTIVDGDMSAREVESFVRRSVGKSGGGKSGGKNKPPAQSADKNGDTGILEKELSATLAAQVRITHHSSGKGALTIYYSTLTTLEKIIARLRKKGR